MLAVVGQDHPLGTNEEDSAVPLRNRPRLPRRGLVSTLVPREPDGGQLSPRTVLVVDVHRGRRNLGVGRWSERLHRPWRLELECPERQINPVASQVAHRPIGEIPPTIPLWPWEIDFVEWAGRGRSEPELPVEASRNL